MASNTFRDSINSLGWSRRDEPVNTSQQSGLLSSIQSLNPFGDRGYVRLPVTESSGAPLPQPTRREEEEGWYVRESTWQQPRSVALRHPCSGTCALHLSHALDHACDADDMPRGQEKLTPVAVSRWDRLMVFGACNLAALACFVICFTLFPVLSLRPRKFVIL